MKASRPDPCDRETRDLPVAAGAEGPPALQFSRHTTAELMFAGVVLPVFCLWIVPVFVAGGMPRPPRDLHGVALSLLGRHGAPFWLLLIYCMTCLTLLLGDPPNAARSLAVRLGICLGPVLALGYWILLCLALLDIPPGNGTPLANGVEIACAVFVTMIHTQLAIWPPLLVERYVVWGLTNKDHDGHRVLILLVAAPLYILSLPVFWIWLLIVPLCLIAAPGWALMAYAYVAWRLMLADGGTRFRFTLAQVLLVFLVAALYFGTWRLSILWALQGG